MEVWANDVHNLGALREDVVDDDTDARVDSLGRDNKTTGSKRPRLTYECDICQTSYTEKRTLNRHRKTPTHCRKAGIRAQDFVCQACRKSFTRLDLLRRHDHEVHLGQRRRRPANSTTGTKDLISGFAFESYAYCEVETPGAERRHDSADGSNIVLLDLEPKDLALDEQYPSPSLLLQQRAHCEATPGVFSKDQSSTDTLPSIRYDDIALAPQNNADTDTASVTSTSTVASTVSSKLNLTLPFRSRLSPTSSGERDPRPQPLRCIEPCPLCKKEFGMTEAAVKEHMDKHLADLSANTGNYECQICSMCFVHQQDLKFHIKGAENSTCGFEFLHLIPCTGHHPPSDPDHDKFKEQVRLWEAMQLDAYREYVNDYANGEAATNAPHYAGLFKAAYMRSTGSINSAWSYFSTHSAPAVGPSQLRLAARKTSLPIIRSTTALLRGKAFKLNEAIKSSDTKRIRELLSQGAILRQATGLSDIVSLVIQNVDVDTLGSLLEHDRTAIFQEILMLDNLSDHGSECVLTLSACFQSVILDALSQEHIDKIPACVRLLLSHGVLCDYMFVAWAVKQNVGTLLPYLDLNARDAISQRSVLQNAIRDFDQDIIRSLFETEGYDVRSGLREVSPNMILSECLQGVDEARIKLEQIDKLLEFVQLLLSFNVEVDSASLVWTARQGLNQLLSHAELKAHWFNARDRNGSTLLAMAASGGRWKLVNTLLHNGACPTTPDRNGQTALMKLFTRDAVAFDAVIAARLLDHGAEIDAQDSEGRTALMLAAKRGCLGVITELLDRGAQVNTEDGQGWNALMVAVSRGDLGIMTALLDRGSNVNTQNHDGQTPLMLAVRGGGSYGMLCDLLIQRGAGIDEREKAGDTALAHSLHPSDHNRRSTDGQRLQTVSALLKCGANVNIEDRFGRRALCFAAAAGLLQACKFLIEQGSSTSRAEHSFEDPLFQAVENGHHAVCAFLIDHGLSVEFVGYTKRTLLMTAAEKGQLSICQLLLSKGVEVDMGDGHSKTALCYASSRGHADIVNLLLAHGAEVDRTDRYGKSPLVYASLEGHADVVKILFEHGADSRVKNSLKLLAIYLERDGSDAQRKISALFQQYEADSVSNVMETEDE